MATITITLTNNDDVLDLGGPAGDQDVVVTLGQDGADSIIGVQGDDLIFGGEGNDTISSNFAVLTPSVQGDTVYGGGGDDIITTVGTTGNTSSIGDLVFGGDGNDTIIGAVNSGLAIDTDTLSGDAGNDVIDGNGGEDQIFGGLGDDLVLSRDEADTTDGGAGIDTIDFSNRDAGGTPVDAGPVIFNIDTGATTAFGDVESNINYENVIGSVSDDQITGSAVANSIDGGDGADTLSGAEGSDSFVSGAGDDSILGGDEGGDTDTLDYSDVTGGLTVTYTGDEAGTASGAGTGTDTFAEIEQITYTGEGDTANLAADTGGVTLDTGAGADFVEGGQGADSLDGGAGIDTLSYTASSDPVTLDIGAGTGSSGNAAGDSFVNFENFALTDGDDVVVGSDGPETVAGLGGDDSIAAAGGDDSVSGGEGNDTIDGGAGNDTLAGDGGDDLFVVDPGAGDDSITGGETGETAGDTLRVTANTGDTVTVNNDAADPEGDAGEVVVVDSDGNTVSVITFDEIENVEIVCFARGTRIATPGGDVAVEDLAEGDMVLTRDAGAQPIRWVKGQSVPATGRLAPVVIAAGALGNDRELVVSPQHRMLLADWRAEVMFGEPEVLAAAKHLVNGDTIHVREGGSVEYFHILFDTHQIVTANGALSESFHPGQQNMGAFDDEIREEIFSIFPELRVDLGGYGPSARPALKAYETRALRR